MRRQKQLSACKNEIICTWETCKWCAFVHPLLQSSSNVLRKVLLCQTVQEHYVPPVSPAGVFPRCMLSCLTAVGLYPGCTCHPETVTPNPTTHFSAKCTSVSEHDIPEEQLSAWVKGGLFLPRLLRPHSSYPSAVSCICSFEEPLGRQDPAVIDSDAYFTFPSPTSPYCACSLGCGRRWTWQHFLHQRVGSGNALGNDLGLCLLLLWFLPSFWYHRVFTPEQLLTMLHARAIPTGFARLLAISQCWQLSDLPDSRPDQIQVSPKESAMLLPGHQIFSSQAAVLSLQG